MENANFLALSLSSVPKNNDGKSQVRHFQRRHFAAAEAVRSNRISNRIPLVDSVSVAIGLLRMATEFGSVSLAGRSPVYPNSGRAPSNALASARFFALVVLSDALSLSL